MPFSSPNGKAAIDFLIGRVQPKTGLDIGPGCGTYATRYPLISWDAVEIFEPYVAQYKLRDLYINLAVRDVREIQDLQRIRDQAQAVPYDLILFGDVLEHMEASEAQACLERARLASPLVIVSIPIGHYPQGPYAGNPHEAHVTDHWTVTSFVETFGTPSFLTVEKEIGIFAFARGESRDSIRRAY